MEHSNCKCMVIIIGSDHGRKCTVLEVLEDLEGDIPHDYRYFAYIVSNMEFTIVHELQVNCPEHTLDMIDIKA